MGFELEHCCFCIDLRIGCLIIGYLNLIGDFALILMTILGLTALGNVGITFHGSMSVMGAIITSVFAVSLIVCTLFLVFTIVLLVGIHQHKRGHVKAYLIYTLIFLILYTIMFLAGFAGIGHTPLTIARDVISIILSIYFLIVVRSYYLTMDEPNLRPAMYNTA
ncbi:uncharacterized protein LOC113503878 [Trichoplusia ni]|uniref:Uncharacterized protein LOC113503878 n=1 Tax=Trichoplusia ni TaxID=7111 RepID=A0A7E5WM27_TRINI|nr:uncharacterized protein LOC113503878 [Trichoplusia ni]